MRISVVMAAYNGGRFIGQQLLSLYKQTRKPDEVLIMDDGSTDDTREIVSGFIYDHRLEGSWRLMVNEKHKGCTLNFLDGAEQAAGEVVFYADQDDIWHPRKIELMEHGFQAYPDMQACYCLRHLIDAEGRRLPVRFAFMNNVRVRTKGFQKVSVSEAVKYNKSPGLCLAVRKSLIRELRPMILERGLTHDLPVGTAAAIHGGYYVLNRKLVLYRQHGTNASSARYTVGSRLTGIEMQTEGRRLRLVQMEAVLDYYRAAMTPRDIRNLERAVEETRDSITDLQERRLGRLFRSVFSMNPMMNRWIAVNNLLTAMRNRI